jgi:O-acetyl-ADP-ribose deacetylase (regulator of RNase III)
LIIYKSTSDNIFDSTAQVLVDPVNCVGRSGDGLALLFKEKFSEQEKVFIARCKANKLKMGTVLPVPLRENYNDPDEITRVLVYFPTKVQPKFNSDERGIYEGLVALRQVVLQHDLKSIAIPALGCGLGNLSFERVKKAIEYVFDSMKYHTTIEVYPPHED